MSAEKNLRSNESKSIEEGKKTQINSKEISVWIEFYLFIHTLW